MTHRYGNAPAPRVNGDSTARLVQGGANGSATRQGFFVLVVYPWKKRGLPATMRESFLPGVFARLVAALVFKTSGGFEQSSLWVRFPYTPAPFSLPALCPVSLFFHLQKLAVLPGRGFL